MTRPPWHVVVASSGLWAIGFTVAALWIAYDRLVDRVLGGSQ